MERTSMGIKDATVRTVTIGEMIPSAAMVRIEAMVHDGARRAGQFLPVLREYRAEMEGRGILPEYAAYALEYAVAKTRGGK